MFFFSPSSSAAGAKRKWLWLKTLKETLNRFRWNGTQKIVHTLLRHAFSERERNSKRMRVRNGEQDIGFILHWKIRLRISYAQSNDKLSGNNALARLSSLLFRLLQWQSILLIKRVKIPNVCNGKTIKSNPINKTSKEIEYLFGAIGAYVLMCRLLPVQKKDFSK